MIRRVNAWTQWGRLRTIVVGSADNACFQPPYQPCHAPTINDEELAKVVPWPEGRKHPDVIARANKQLDGLVQVLEKEGVAVLRPDNQDWHKPITTPFWEVPNQYCAVCPRDVMITVGNNMIEASMSRRDRFFEVAAYRSIVEQAWQADPEAQWKAAPKTLMEDEMYDETWLQMPREERLARMRDAQFCLKSDRGIVFDAADFTRTGKHVFGQVSMTTNLQGIHWLQRELASQDIIVHPIRFHYDTVPSHIDCTFVVLKPGLVMTNPDRPIFEEDAEIWKRNGWEFVDAPLPDNPIRPAFSQSSKWLSMNVLVISPDKVIVEQDEESTARLLESLGFEVIPIPFRDVFEFGGSLHCATWDIERDDEKVDLFAA